jgi:hypothetical protein
VSERVEELLGVDGCRQDSRENPHVVPAWNDPAKIDDELRAVMDDVREVEIMTEGDLLVDRDLELGLGLLRFLRGISHSGTFQASILAEARNGPF